MIKVNLFARVYLSIDLDRAHSHMRSWCGTTMCIGGRVIQLMRPDLDLRTMDSGAAELGKQLAGGRISRYDVPIVIQEAAANRLGIPGWQAEYLFHSGNWYYFWPTCGIRDGEQSDAPAMLTAMEKFIEHYYPHQFVAFRLELERLRAVQDACTTQCVEA